MDTQHLGLYPAAESPEGLLQITLFNNFSFTLTRFVVRKVYSEMKHELITSSDMSGKWMDLPSPPAGPGSSLTTSYGKETGYGRKAHLGHQPDTSLFQCIYFLSCALTGVS